MSYNDRIIDEFRGNGGAVADYGDDLVLLHSVGARSGEPRIHPLMAVRDGDDLLVAASKGGAPDNPAWYHNLRARPDAEVEVPDGAGGISHVAVRATEVGPDDYDAVWRLFTARSPWFATYAERAGRRIPVMRLAPR